jgi:transcriptional regulator with XRE-family HTH domain
MQHIGSKIKELRRKRDMTQEKLADYLGVTYQAVSKWETGAACPDISYIPPLTRLFGVTADELLGLTPHETDSLRAETERIYTERATLPLEEQKKAAEQAVANYPHVWTYRKWLADTVYSLAVTEEDDDLYRTEMEKAVELYEMLLEGAGGQAERGQALWGMVMALTCLGRRDEARAYADLYPDEPTLAKKEIRAWCAEGEEQAILEQEILNTHLVNFLGALFGFSSSLPCQQAVTAIIEAMFPDGNYFDYNDQLYISHVYMAKILTAQGRYDEAIAALAAAKEYARAFDRIFVDAPGTYRYTSPMLNKVSFHTADFFYSGIWRREDGFREWLDNPCFVALCRRKDFLALYE